jgi:uncharacterized repeat protein (TIGR03803 family)
MRKWRLVALAIGIILLSAATILLSQSSAAKRTNPPETAPIFSPASRSGYSANSPAGTNQRQMFSPPAPGLSFAPAVTYGSGGNAAYSVTVADVNGDGRPDIVVGICVSTNCDTGIVGVLLGSGDGTFQAAVTYSSGGFGPSSVTVADVNGDGSPDIVVANRCVSSSNCFNGIVGVLLGNGDGTFQAAVTYSSEGCDALSVTVADVNGDGRPDIVVANYCVSSSNCANGIVGVLLGNGDGTFQAAVTYSSGGGFGALSVTVADVNGDGRPDIVAGNECASSANCANGTVGVLLGNGDGTFQAAVAYSSGGFDALSVTVADVNGDGRPDIVVANYCVSSSNCANGIVGVLLGNGDGTFQPAVNYSSGEGGERSVAVADLNADGRPDVLVASGSVVGVLLNLTPYLTTKTLTSSANPAGPNQSVTYTATVTNSQGKAVTGRVTFKDGGKNIATVNLKKNEAAYTISCKTTGTHSITATYSGDANDAGSTSGILKEFIENLPVPTTTKVTTSGSPVFVNPPVTFTATITSRYGAIPNGETATFYDGATKIGTGIISASVATFTTSSLTVKTHTIRVAYGGDPTFKSSSGTVQQIVWATPVSTTLYAFKGFPDARDPGASLVQDAAGNLYGTSYEGGTSDYGTAFKIATNGNESLLHSFIFFFDGASPMAGLIFDSAGNLYGTAYVGGTYGLGSVFKIDTTGTLTLLHSCLGPPDCEHIDSGLVQDATELLRHRH